jgi:post-segregation antitoxin (ccd killing protein)
VYLDAAVQDNLTVRAKARGIEVARLVNELLRKDIELIDAAWQYPPQSTHIEAA